MTMMLNYSLYEALDIESFNLIEKRNRLPKCADMKY